jgi:hypothetical protein
MACRLVQFGILPCRQRVVARRSPETSRVFSCDGQNFIAYKVNANPFRRGLVEEKSGCRVDDVLTQFFPGLALREDILCQAFSAITAISLLYRLEHQICHIEIMLLNFTRPMLECARGVTCRWPGHPRSFKCSRLPEARRSRRLFHSQPNQKNRNPRKSHILKDQIALKPQIRRPKQPSCITQPCYL